MILGKLATPYPDGLAMREEQEGIGKALETRPGIELLSSSSFLGPFKSSAWSVTQGPNPKHGTPGLPGGSGSPF